MNDWEKALWMIEEGFTVAQLKQLQPSDADAWKRLKPIAIENGVRFTVKSKTKDKLTKRIELMKEAISKCDEMGLVAWIDKDGHRWYYTADVMTQHSRSKGTFYSRHMNYLVKEKILLTRFYNRRAMICLLQEEVKE